MTRPKMCLMPLYAMMTRPWIHLIPLHSMKTRSRPHLIPLHTMMTRSQMHITPPHNYDKAPDKSHLTVCNEDKTLNTSNSSGWINDFTKSMSHSSVCRYDKALDTPHVTARNDGWTVNMSNYTIRLATLEDEEDVMKIGIMYDGLDYLPYFYQHFISDNAYRCFVCEVEGEVIGFSCMLLHDNQSTVQFRAGRIKLSHRGQGYFKILVDRMEEAAKNTPAISTLSVRNENTVNLKTLLPHHIRVMYRGHMALSLPKSVVPAQSVYLLTERDLKSIFEDRELCQHLFPADLIYMLSLAVGLLPSNIKYIINDTSRVMATTSHGSARFGAKDTGLLTTGSSFHTPAGCRLTINVFGKDVFSLKDHVQQHLKVVETSSGKLLKHLKLAEPSCQKVWLEIGVNDDFPADVVHDVYSSLGLRQSPGFQRMCTFKNPLNVHGNKH